MTQPAHFKKYGKFLTPDLIDQLGVPLPQHGDTITKEQLDDHVILGALILDYATSDPRKELFLDVMDSWRETLAASVEWDNGVRDDSNSVPIVRCAQVSREHIRMFEHTSKVLIEKLYDKSHWTTNYLDSGKLSQYHPFVQFMYLVEAQDEAIRKLEESLPVVPLEEIDVPTN